MPWPPGTPCWVDLAAPDPDAASAFYADLFGWEVRTGPPRAAGYRMALLRGSVVGGIRPFAGPAAWTTYLSSDDLRATARAITDSGGRVVYGPVSLLSEGAIALARDATGVVFGIWEAGQLIGAELVNEHGGLCWSELLTSDAATSRAFHAGVFGYAYTDSGGEDFTYDMMRLDGTAVAGMAAIGGPPGHYAVMEPQWLTYFSVEDCDRVSASAAALGGRVQVAPTDTPHGRMALLRGRTGELFGVLEADDLPRPTQTDEAPFV